MLIDYYSDQEIGLLLHRIFRYRDLDDTTGFTRIDIADEKETLQAAVIRADEGKTFVPHKHIECKRQTDRTAEMWIVIQGQVKASYYDIDDELIGQEILCRGDCTMTFHGGHNYQFLTDDSVVIECKNGPYRGADSDKRVIK
jgi:hypothetical protein